MNNAYKMKVSLFCLPPVYMYAFLKFLQFLVKLIKNSLKMQFMYAIEMHITLKTSSNINLYVCVAFSEFFQKHMQSRQRFSLYRPFSY